jgi:hypothetical protein
MVGRCSQPLLLRSFAAAAALVTICLGRITAAAADSGPVPQSCQRYPIAEWMGCTAPAIQNLTLLDLALPGTHDTLTYDLSETFSDNANDLPPALAALLHDLHDFAGIGEAVRRQAATQQANITQQLDAGIRFIDLRVTFSAAPDSPSPAADARETPTSAWYGLHMLQTHRPVLEYLGHIKAWVAAHPTEVVVVWLSRHGDPCGTTFPGTTVAQRQRFWREVVHLFGPLLYRGGRWNETSMHEYTEVLKQRVVFAVSDGREDDGQMVPDDLRDTAMNGCAVVDNQLGIDVADVGRTARLLATLRADMAGRRARDKAANRLYLMSMSGGATKAQMVDAVLLHLLERGLHVPAADVANLTKACGESFNLPVPIPTWCPPTLASIGRLTNYYAQSFFETAVNNGSVAAGLLLPGAIYIDQVSPTPDGTLLTGAPDNPATSPRYAYTASTVLASLRSLGCGAPVCLGIAALYTDLRASAPLNFAINTTEGRDGPGGW